MTAFQWAFAVASALTLAAILEVGGHWVLARMVASHTPGPRVLRVARFAFFSIFFFYSVLRTMTPALDAHIHPLAALFGLLAVWAVVGGIVSRRVSGR